MKFITTILLICTATLGLMAQNLVQLSGEVIDQNGQPLPDVVVQIPSNNSADYTDQSGSFSLTLIKGRTYRILFSKINSEPREEKVTIESDTSIIVILEVIASILPDVIVKDDADAFGIRQLRSVEDGGLYVGKKTEVINIDKLVVNKAANNARQALSKVPSLNIWESDNAGLQLDIGGRGLSPKRSANFNTRQNGYDMSADALGYPESYYHPPFQSVKQVEVVRGAGALQYGSQFGGLINFKLKKGDPSKKVAFESHNTYGANEFINT